VLAFLRRTEQETILVVANLSRFAQWVEVDLSAFVGQVPVELFGTTKFPAVTEAPYRLVLGPHSFLWFSLSQETIRSPRAPLHMDDLPRVVLSGNWEHLKYDASLNQVELALLPYVQHHLLRLSPRDSLRRIRIRDISVSERICLPADLRR
jgi:maltose alpha-D-glucosyltransferase/alpha-amylase